MVAARQLLVVAVALLVRLAALAVAAWGVLVELEQPVRVMLAGPALQAALMVAAAVVVRARLGLMARQLPAETAETA